MLASELAEPYPTVGLGSSAVEAARLLTEHHRPALVVVDEHDHPVAILPGSQVLRLVIPGYLQDDVKLASVVDDSFVDQMCDALVGKTVAELLPRDHDDLPVVRPDDTVLEVAVLMVVERSPLVAVVDGPGKTAPMIGAITLTTVLREILPERLGERGATEPR
ncbi:CBS domain-containing protein [Nocardioides sp. T2.26MG-1]|uniref:CBS domain-containing protein n=1 Tax=Nocardioides sp. T2.26MG-1 TaxID=3041166 RepID=UPI00247742A2|nr:CBS domain-containing protein [Nocardioides sp. T2.26MG-1]CAI9401011.1 hypothetical protein HIDPHFAB_00521 [Nocardioides sp. T2.26MG-1]